VGRNIISSRAGKGFKKKYRGEKLRQAGTVRYLPYERVPCVALCEKERKKGKERKGNIMIMIIIIIMPQGWNGRLV